jgi:hypothetical protein
MKNNGKLILSAANHCRLSHVKAFLRDGYGLVPIIRVVPRDRLLVPVRDEGFFVFFKNCRESTVVLALSVHIRRLFK